jgi:hypothetical protein
VRMGHHPGRPNESHNRSWTKWRPTRRQLGDRTVVARRHEWQRCELRQRHRQLAERARVANKCSRGASSVARLRALKFGLARAEAVRVGEGEWAAKCGTKSRPTRRHRKERRSRHVQEISQVTSDTELNSTVCCRHRRPARVGRLVLNESAFADVCGALQTSTFVKTQTRRRFYILWINR